MRILYSCILLLLVSVPLSLNAAAEIELRAFPDEALDVFDKRIQRLLLRLPEDPVAAGKMLHEWNASVATGSDIGKNLIPRLEELYGARPSSVHGLERWRELQKAQVYYASEHRLALEFDLLKSEHVKGALLMLIPDDRMRSGEELCKRLQLFVDNKCRVLGLALPEIKSNQGISISVSEGLYKIAQNSGIAKLQPGNYAMIFIGILLFYLAIVKGFEPLLLVPIAAGCIFVNAAGAGMGEAGGFLHYFYTYGIETSIFPLLIFMGVGAMTDFGPLLSNPWMALLGGAAQFGIFGCFALAVLFGDMFGLDLTLQQIAAIAIIGGADGPTAIYGASKLAPELLGPIAVAAYSYMALVPLIQPPVMRLLTTDAERKISMTQRSPVSKRAKIVFPITVIVLCILTLPEAAPLIGMLMLGNLMKESGVVDRLSNTAQNELINLVTIGLGLSVGMKMSSAEFLDVKTMGILALGIVAFVMGTAAGVIMAKVLNKISGGKINPLIGSAGVSAVPMAARVSQNEGAKYNKTNFLLMHAMGPNVAGVIGSAVAAGILLSLLKG